MGKLILLLTFLATALLYYFGIANPNSPVVWLASTSEGFMYLRILIMAALIALLFTHPPRNPYLRMIVGVFAMGIAGWSLSAIYLNHMKLLDSLTLLQFSSSAGLAILERDYQHDDEYIKINLLSIFRRTANFARQLTSQRLMALR